MLELTPSEINALRKLQRNLAGSSDYARVTCILMLGMGNPPSFVAKCLGIDPATVYRYRSAYIHGGAGELLENRHKGYWGLLDSHQQAVLCKELCEHVYTDSKSVARWIKATFGVEYNPQGVVDLLNRLGFTYKKTTEALVKPMHAASRNLLRNWLIRCPEWRRMRWFTLQTVSIRRIIPVLPMPGFRKVNVRSSQP